jgi:hypothetical protein
LVVANLKVDEGADADLGTDATSKKDVPFLLNFVSGINRSLKAIAPLDEGSSEKRRRAKVVIPHIYGPLMRGNAVIPGE